jgi:type IV pilus assembly protein PilW
LTVTAKSSCQFGFTIVEILVSLTISLVLLGGVINVFLSSKQGYRVNEALAWVQESGRFGLDIISRDVRQAGYNASNEVCGGNVALGIEIPINNTGPLETGRLRITLNDPQDHANNWLAMISGKIDAVRGYDGKSSGWGPVLPTEISALNPIAGTDIIRIHKSSNEGSAGSLKIYSHPGSGNPNSPGSADLKIEGTSAAEAEYFPVFDSNCRNGGDWSKCIALAMDKNCEVGAVLQITNFNSNNGNTVHNTGIGDPGNRTKNLGRSFEGGYLIPGISEAAVSTTYYIATGASGLPTLFQSIDDAAGEELVDGIQDMQILYGVDTSNNNSVDNYVVASAVTDWSKVLAARISLLAQSYEANITTEGENQNLTFNGAAVNTSDRRLRQVFTTTVTLRNRVP